MYLVAGMVARSVAGPGVVFSFIIAAIASIFSGECIMLPDKKPKSHRSHQRTLDSTIDAKIIIGG